MITQLKSFYDLIIIDSAPISAISDALVLARLSDIIIMAVRWGRTPQGLVCSILNQIATTGRQVDGIVLSRVRVSELETYEYGSYKQSAKYYMSSSPPAVVDAHA